MTSEPDEDQVPTLEFINSEVAARLDRQSEAGGKIDTKALFLVGFVATAAQFLATRDTVPLIAALAFCAYAVAFAFGIATFNVTAYEDIEPRVLLESSSEASKGRVLLTLAATKVTIFERNDHRNKRKVRRWKVSLVSTALGLALSTAGMVLHTDDHGREPESESAAESINSEPTGAEAKRH